LPCLLLEGRTKQSKKKNLNGDKFKMTNLKRPPELMDHLKTSEKKIEDFADILNDLADVTDKKKLLWKEIYENAVRDRSAAGALFTEAYRQMQNGTAEHITLGATLTKYLERMGKSNEQILRLAELISKSESRQAKIDPDDLYAQIKES